MATGLALQARSCQATKSFVIHFWQLSQNNDRIFAKPRGRRSANGEMTKPKINPYAPTAETAEVTAAYLRRSWIGYPIVSIVLCCMGLAFIMVGLFFAKIALIDASPSPENQRTGIGLLVAFVLAGILQLIAATFFYREAVKTGLTLLVASPLVILILAAYLHFANG